MTHTLSLCRNCVHFVKAPHVYASIGERIAMGRCTRFAETNLVTGATTAPYAATARKYYCKGEQFVDLRKK